MFGWIESKVPKKDIDGKGSEMIDVDVLGGGTVSKRILYFLILILIF
jgi:hypothetical protein